MVCVGQMVVVYLHKQNEESFYLSICTQNRASFFLSKTKSVRKRHRLKATALYNMECFGAGLSLISTSQVHQKIKSPEGVYLG
jgi:hypothetical protein